MTATMVKTTAGSVSALFDGPKDAAALVVLAPGAGAGIDSPFMDYVAAGIGKTGIRVCRFNFAYTEVGKKSPDRQPILEATYREVVEHIRTNESPAKLFLGGKSMGGRIASHIAASGTGCDGLVFFGYPLHPPGRPERLRDEHLADVGVPMLFIEGTRDPFCPLDTLKRVIDERSLDAEVFVVEDGDHSLKVRKSSGRSTEAAWDEAIGAATGWVQA